jgi:N,N'-diacetyllegionaminate synthase
MTFQIGNRAVGLRHPTLVIAEACDNHMGDLDVAIEMVRQAKLARADVIKFQHHLPDEEMLPDAPMSDNFEEPLYEFLKKHALRLADHRKLKAYCEEVGIIYLCTPFSWKAAQELATLNVSAFKIGSGEMTDVPSLKRIAGLGRPMILSTGMATLEEIQRTYEALVPLTPISLLSCVSEYPPVYEDINLGVIQVMQQRFPKALIGHSDHTPDLFTCYAAVALGARIIEKHVILDKRTPGPDQSVSINFQELAELVDGIRKIEVALGSEKSVHGREQQIRTWAFRSVVSMRDIRAGEILSEEMLWTKRPGTGIPSHVMPQLYGRKVTRDIRNNKLLEWADIEGPPVS